ncbi:MAG TPA: alanine dehydrogenase [Cytophagales bacterium]|nr:alanine dehydrogenase [Cytophagales bacterium]
MNKPRSSGFAQLAQETSLYPQEKLAAVAEPSKSLRIGIPKEVSMQENRVALSPGAVALLVANGHEVTIESGAGQSSKFADQEYSEAGAKIEYSTEEVYKSNMVLKVEPPTLEEIEYFKPGQTLISALQPGQTSTEYIKALNKKRITALGFELIEDKVGGMPVVRAMSEIAGSTSMLIAAEYLSTVQHGQGIVLGGITGVPPTNVGILGAGTVAEYAARAALGLGVNIKIFDNQIYRLRRIRHALGHQVYTSILDTMTLRDALHKADVVIGAIRAEKGRNLCVVTEEMVMEMKPDSIIIDVSIDQGGCVETSEVTSHNKPVFRKHDIIHYCVPNIASRVARTATLAFSHIFTPILLQAGEMGGMEEMIFSQRWFMRGVYTYKGSLVNLHLARKLNMEYRDIELFRAAMF